MAKVWKKQSENFDSLIDRFKRKCINENIFQEIKAKEFYKSPNDVKKEKALKNFKKKRGEK